MATAIDNLGRKIDTANMTLGEIKGLIGTLMTKATGPAQPVKDAVKNESSIKGLQSLLRDFTKNFSSEIAEQTKMLSQVVDALKEFTELKNSKPKDKNGKNMPTKEEKQILKSSQALAKEFHKTLGTKGSGWVHDIHCEVLLKKILETLLVSDKKTEYMSGVEREIETAVKNAQAKAGGSRGGGGENDRRLFSDDPLEAYALTQMLSQVSTAADKLQDVFLGFNPFATIFKGIIDEERKFTEDIRATTFEILGATKESKNLQKVYERIGQTTKETGFDRTEAQKTYNKYLRSGIKDMNKALSITKAQLNAESLIGVEAGSLNEQFAFMAHAAHMSTTEIATMGRGMLEIARNTGITGEELSSAIKSSQGLMENFQKSGRLTTDIAKNLTEISASAQKLGVSSELGADLKAMSSSYDFIYQTSAETQGFLLKAANSVGKTAELYNGSMLSTKENIKALSKGYGNVLKDMSRGVTDIPEKAMESAESLNAYLSTLTDAQKDQIDRNLKAVNGADRGLGTVVNELTALAESGKTLEDRLSEIAKKRKLGLTEEERLAEAEKERGLLASANLDIVSKLTAATKGVGSGVDGMNEALAIFEKQNKNALTDDLKAMGKEWSSSSDVAKKAIADSLEQLNVGRKKAGMKAIKIDSTEIEKALQDKESLKLLTSRLEEGQRELANEQKKSVDPMTEANQYLSEINDNIRNYTQSVFGRLFNSLIAKVVIVTGVLGSLVAGVGLNLTNIARTFSGFKRGFGFATGATKAAATTTPLAGGIDAYLGVGASGATDVASATAPAKNMMQSIIGQTDEFANKLGDFFTPFKDAYAGARKAGESYIQGIEKAIPAQVKSVKFLEKSYTMFEDGLKGTYTQIGKLGTKLTTSNFSVLQKLGGNIEYLSKVATKAPIGPFIGAITAATTAMSAGSRAAETFGKTQETLTLNEQYSAKAAGLLVGSLLGVIDVFTFGLGSLLIGLLLPVDDFTDSLAILLAKFPLLTVILSPLTVAIDVLFGAIYGVVLGIWEIIKGIGGGVMNILNPIMQGITDIFSTLGNLFGPTSEKANSLLTAFNKLGGVFGIVSGTIKFIGTAIGFIFRAIGSVIGFIIKSVFTVVTGLLYVFKPLGMVMGAVWDALSQVGLAIYDIFAGVGNLIWTIVGPIASLFSSSEESTFGFFSVLKSLSSFIGKLGGLLAIVFSPILYPLMIISKLISGIAKLIQAVVKVFQGDFSGAGELVKQAMWGLVEGIIWPFKYLYDVLVGHSIVPDLVMGIINWFSQLPQKIIGFIASIPVMILKITGRILSFIPSLIGDAILGGLDLLKSIGMTIIDVLTYPFRSILNFFSAGLGDSIIGVVKNIFSVIFDFFTLGWRLTAYYYKAIGAIISAVYNTIAGVVQGIFSVVSTIFGFIQNTIGSLLQGFSVIFEPIKMIFSNIWEGISSIGSAFSSVFSAISDAFSWLGSWFGGGKKDNKKGVTTSESDNAILSATTEIAKGFYQVIKDLGVILGQVGVVIIEYILWPINLLAAALNSLGKIIQAIVKVFQGDFSSAGDLIKQAFMGIVNALFSPVKQVFNLFGTIINGIVSFFVNFTSKVYEFIGSIPLAIGNLIENSINFVKSLGMKLIEILTFPMKYILNFFGAGVGDGVVNKIKDIFGAIFDIITAPIMRIAKIFQIIGKTFKMLGKVFQGDFSGAFSLLKDIGKSIVELLLYPFTLVFNLLKSLDIFGIFEVLGNIGSWLWKNVSSSMSNFGTWLWNNTVGALAGFGTWLWNNTVGALAGFGTWLYNNSVGALLNMVPTWLKGYLGMSEAPAEKAAAAATTAMTTTAAQTGVMVNANNQVTTSTPAVQTAMQPVGNVRDVHNLVATDMASTQPNKTEVLAPELGILAAETSEQTDQLNTLINLFQQVVDAMKPKSISRAEGGMPGNTASNEIVHKPANFYRSTVGLVAQTSGKAVLNYGTPNA